MEIRNSLTFPDFTENIVFFLTFPDPALIKNSEYFLCYFHENLNYCLEQSLLFPHHLKLDVASAYKKKSKASKDNYRPVSF